MAHINPLNHQQGLWPGLFLLSAATLTFEINLTRLFSVAQFYHFAFMIVSVALLGFGASGTALTIFPALLRGKPQARLGQLALAAGVSMLAAYLLTNWLPFDSFSIAWDRRQVLILILHYLALAAPFFFSGMALGFLLTVFPKNASTTYAVNLLGSASGCVVALVAPAYLGGEGMVTLSAALAALAAVLVTSCGRLFKSPAAVGAAALLVFTFLDLGLRFTGRPGFSALVLRISPYKSLSYALQYPGSKVTYRRWNAFSRIDVVQSAGIHSVPGLSYRYLQPLPALDGLLVDGDDLSPLFQPSKYSTFVAYLPSAVAFYLHPQASTLVLEPRGGLDVLTGTTLSTGPLACVESNPLIIEAAPIYADARLLVYRESGRSFLQRTQEQYDIIVLSLAASFHPVQSGAYTLAEDYRYTVESFQDMLAHLTPGGLLVSTRWLQDPPSEDLRLFSLAVTALETSGADPRLQLVSFRGYNTATILMKNGAFTPGELAAIREFTAQRAFDLTYAPGIQPDETNQYNILTDSRYYQAYIDLLDANPRQDFYADYDYDVRPPTDDHPFFGHYFKWAQAPQILAGFGKAWQPFGGAGYFVILALLLIAMLLAAALILLPVLLWKRSNRIALSTSSPFVLRNLAYFGLLGFAFLFVEIPLLQRFILYLGHPAYAVTAVLFSLLLFSGLGSRWSDRIPILPALGTLVILTLVAPSLLSRVFAWTLGLPLATRLGVTTLILSPLGFLMGIPFPAGIRLLTQSQKKARPSWILHKNQLSLRASALRERSNLKHDWRLPHWAKNIRIVMTIQSKEPAPRADIPWIWAVNGAASVISAILAALLALTFGFSSVLWTGAFCYAGALFTAWVSVRPGAVRCPAR